MSVPEVKKAESPAENIQVTREDLSVILSKVIEEAKKPYVDLDAEARKLRDRKRLQEERTRQEALRKAREESCAHMREDNTSAIAWMQNSDGIWRGVCQRCNALFTPEHPKYVELIRIPTRALHIVG